MSWKKNGRWKEKMDIIQITTVAALSEISLGFVVFGTASSRASRFVKWNVKIPKKTKKGYFFFLSGHLENKVPASNKTNDKRRSSRDGFCWSCDVTSLAQDSWHAAKNLEYSVADSTFPRHAPLKKKHILLQVCREIHSLACFSNFIGPFQCLYHCCCFYIKKLEFPWHHPPQWLSLCLTFFHFFWRALRRPFPVLFQKKSFFLNLMNPPDFFPLSDKKIC